MPINCGNCGSKHDTVQDVKDCHILPPSTNRSKRRATDKQRDFAHGLLRSRKSYGMVEDIELSNSLEAAHEYVNGMDFDQIKEFIGKMKTQPKRTDGGVRTATVLVGEGMYRRDGGIFKVQRAVHGSGHLYAKRLTERGFEYAPGMLTALLPEDKMTLDEAKEYGALYGVCVVCGRTLTDEASIEAGIGPICAGKEFWG